MCQVMELVFLFVNNYCTLQCPYEAGKCNKIQLLDLLCEALDPDLYTSRTSDNHVVFEKDVGVPMATDLCIRRKYSRKGGFISQIVCKVRWVTCISNLEGQYILLLSLVLVTS